MSNRFILFGWLAFMALCSWLMLAHTPVTTDLTLFIPKSDTQAELLLEQLRSGPTARLILLGLEGGTEQERAETSRRLAEQLRTTGLFVRVANGENLLNESEQQWLFKQRYLLSRADFSVEGLRRALQQRLRELASPLSAFTKQLLPADPTGTFLNALQTEQTDRQPTQRLGVWFSPDGQRAVLLVETQASGFDLDAQEQVLNAIQLGFVNAQQGSVSLLLSGTGVFSILSRDTIRTETQWLSGIASVLLMALLWLIYRSPRVVLLAALPLASAIVVAIAAVGLLFGGIYGITLAFGITLLGVAIDYPIHLFSHLYPQATVEQNIKSIWPTLRLGTLTTAIAYLAMITADFVGLAQLGVFAITGLFTAALVTRWVLPALLPPIWTPPHVPNERIRLYALLKLPRWLGAATIAASFVILSLGVLSTSQFWEDDLAALSPIPEKLIDLDRELRAQLGAPEAGQVIVINAADAETVLQRSEILAQWLETQKQQGSLTGFDMAALYLPSRKTQRARQAALPTADRLNTDLQQALHGLPFKPNLFVPFLDSVETTRTAPLLNPEDLDGTVLGLRISSLLLQRQASWTALVPLAGVVTDSDLAEALSELSLDEVYYFDLKQETNQLVVEFRNAALLRLAWGAVLLSAVLWLGLGSFKRLFVVLLPVTLAVAVDIALLLLLGKRLSLFHLVSLFLVVGLGLDYSLFFSRPAADVQARLRTLRAVLICCGSTLVVFGMLAFSELPVLQAIGQTVSIGVLISFLMALVLAQPGTHAAENC
ncbi:MAG: MMPL family transporter [Candidatus Competibacteraceae bacterium]|nr:MMPL family transporter [Candidatus Competibacteraceae bacterium]